MKLPDDFAEEPIVFDQYATIGWDDGDTTSNLLYIGPSSVNATRAFERARREDPDYDHLAVVHRQLTSTEWAIT